MANNNAHGFYLTLNFNPSIYAFFRILTSGPAENMASECFSAREMLTALASIPDSLRGFTWWTISELALVSRIPEATLDAMLKPLSKNHKTFQMIRIEKAKERPYGKSTHIVHYYRPFTDLSVHARHFMGSKAGRAANEAIGSKTRCNWNL